MPAKACVCGGCVCFFLSALLFFPKVSEEHSCPLSADSAVEVSDVKSAWNARRPFVLLSVASQPSW